MRFVLFLLAAAAVARAADPASPTPAAPAGDVMRHPNCTKLQWSADGAVLVSTDPAGVAKVWDPNTRKLIHTHLPGKNELSNTYTLSPDGEALAVRVGLGGLRLVEAKTGKEVKSVALPEGWPHQLAFAPDGSELAVAFDARVRFYDPRTLKAKGKDVPVPGGVKEIAYRPDSKALAVCEVRSSALRVVDTKTGKALASAVNKAGSQTAPGTALVAHHGYNSVVWSPDGKSFAAHAEGRSGDPGKFHLFDAATGKEGVELPGLAIGFSPDSRYAICRTHLVKGKGTGHATHLVDVRTGAVALSFGSPLGPGAGSADEVRAGYVLHAETARLAARGDAGGEIAVWTLHTLPEARAPGRGELAPRDGPLVLAADPNGGGVALSVRDRATGKDRAALGPARAAPRASAFSPDGSRVAAVLETGAATHALRVWDAATGKELPAGTPPALDRSALAWSPDGRALAVSARDRTHIFDAATGKELGTIRYPTVRTRGSEPLPLAWSPDGKVLAVANAEHGAAVLFDAGTGRARAALREPGAVWLTAVAFAADGKTVLTAGGAPRAWDATAEPKPLWEFAPAK